MLLVAALMFVAMFLRRIEFASAIHAGITRWNLWTISMLESLLWVAATLQLLLLLQRGGSPADPQSKISQACGHWAFPPNRDRVAGLLGTWLGVGCAREDLLFAQVKGRR